MKGGVQRSRRTINDQRTTRRLFTKSVSSHAVRAQWVIAAAGGGAIAIASYIMRWLTPLGSILSAVIMVILMTMGGLRWLIPLGIFFITGSLLSSIGAVHHEPRNARQVLANGFVPTAVVLANFFNPTSIWYPAFVGAVAASNADTWATELGRFSPREPVSLRTRDVVRKGVSGSVTSIGTGASIAGGAVIGAAAAASSRLAWPDAILVGLVAGTLGSFIDTVLGAWVQHRATCRVCAAVTESNVHCDTETVTVGGVSWVDNDVVNFTASWSGLLCALALQEIFGIFPR